MFWTHKRGTSQWDIQIWLGGLCMGPATTDVGSVEKALILLF